MASRPMANAPDQSGKRVLDNDYSLLSLDQLYEQKSGPGGFACRDGVKGGLPLATRSPGACSWLSSEGYPYAVECVSSSTPKPHALFGAELAISPPLVRSGTTAVSDQGLRLDP